MLHPVQIALVLVFTLATAARAQEKDAAAEPPAVKKSLSLDQLLRPRGAVSSAPPAGGEPGGRGRDQWQEAFRRAQGEVAELETKVSTTQERLRLAASADWNYAAGGTGEASDPEVMKQRAQLKRDRQSLEAARQRLRDLQVEASLAGVPADWRAP